MRKVNYLKVKLKRLVALYLDGIFIMSMSLIFYWFIIWGFHDIRIPNKMYMLLLFLWFSVRDFTFSYRSFGKKIVNLAIYDNLGNEVHDWWKILFLGFVSTLTAPISILTFLFCNQTVGEIILNTIVLPSNYPKNTVEAHYKVNSVIKNIVTIVPLVFIGVLFLFFQRLNFYSIRILLDIVIIGLLWIVLNYLIKNRIFKFITISALSFGTIMISYLVFPESSFLKSTDLLETFYYSYPGRNINYKDELDNSAYIFYEDSVVYYEKDGGYWNVINPLKYKTNNKTLFQKIVVENNSMIEIKYTIEYLYVEKLNQTAVIITVKDITEREVKDSLSTDFRPVDGFHEKKYLAIIDRKLDDSYYVEIGNNIYYLDQ